MRFTAKRYCGSRRARSYYAHPKNSRLSSKRKTHKLPLYLRQSRLPRASLNILDQSERLRKKLAKHGRLL